MLLRGVTLLFLGAGLLVGLLAMQPRAAAVRAADACDPARDRDPGESSGTLVSGGFQRAYILHIPPSYDGQSAMPLVLNFHGLGSDAEEQNDYSGLPEKADEEGFILVAPEGTVTEFIPSRHWNFTTLEAFDDTPDDVAFVAELIDSLVAELCIDTSRVYSTGMSNGAQISVRLACDLSDRFAAVAPVAGSYFPPAFTQISGEPPCESARPVPLLAFHGSADDIIRFEGGSLGLAIPFDTRAIEGAAIPEWAQHNGCDALAEEESVSTNVRLVRYTGCEADVALYVVEGGRHEWPGASGGPGSAAGDEINATDLIWEFFAGHSLTGPLAGSSEQQSVAGSSDSNIWWWIAGAGFAAGALIAAGGAGAFLLRRRSAGS